MSNEEPSPTGLAIVDNWRAMQTGKDLYLTEEVPIFSDGRFTGVVVDGGFGPHSLLNPVPVDDVLGWARPAVVLRLDEYLAPFEDFKMSEGSYFEHYHAGGLSDEVAALISLSTGLRAWAGTSTRTFWPESDPKGGPRTPPRGTDPTLQARERRPVIPKVLEPAPLTDVLVFGDVGSADPTDAATLIQAARLYQQALWLADSEPHFSWLFLVAAVEVVATRWFRGDATPIEVLRDHKPTFCERLELVGGHGAVELVAEELAQSMRATARFLQFSLEHLPAAPKDRPPEHAQVEWTPEKWKRVFSKIYDFRSKSLHAGIPFPLPMCKPPFRHAEWEAPEEKPGSLGFGALGATWRPEDMPVHLHVYERVVRLAFMKWWAGRDTASDTA